MRTTVDLPDDRFRRTKALAALRGNGIKDAVVRAIDAGTASRNPAEAGQAARRVRLPLIRLRSRRKFDLTGFDLDDLLA
jgi:hypothetical protein